MSPTEVKSKWLLEIGGLVVGWVTTSEYPLLYVFCYFFAVLFVGLLTPEVDVAGGRIALDYAVLFYVYWVYLMVQRPFLLFPSPHPHWVQLLQLA
jgi:hypothetical protein